VNTAPVIDLDPLSPALNNNLIYPEASGPMILMRELSIEDLDSIELSWCRVTFVNHQIEQRELEFLSLNLSSPTISITNQVDSIFFDGLRPIGEYERLLRGITYNNLNQNPDDNERIFEIICADDENLQSNPSRVSVHVESIDNPPQIYSPVVGEDNLHHAIFYEGSQGVPVLNTFTTILDPDDTELNQCQINLIVPEGTIHEMLQLPLPSTVPEQIFVNFSPNHHTVLFQGKDTILNYQYVLTLVQYVNTMENPIVAERTVEVFCEDASGLRGPVSIFIVDVVPTNDPPVITLQPLDLIQPTWNEDLQRVNVILNLVPVLDIDSQSLSRCEFHLLRRLNGDLEGLSTQVFDSSILTAYDTQTGLLSLTGPSLINKFNSIIRSIQYFNKDPIPAGTSRLITGQCWDFPDEAPSNVDSIEILLSAVNNPAQLHLDQRALNFIEDSSPIELFPNISISDLDNNLLDHCIVVIRDPHPEEILRANIQGEPLLIDWDVDSGALTLRGPQRSHVFEEALRRVTYTNTRDSFSSHQQIISTWCIDEEGQSSNVPFVSIELIDVNDPPVIELNQNSINPVHFTQNDPPVAITERLEISDPDGTILTSCQAQLRSHVDLLERLSVTIPFGTSLQSSWNLYEGTLLVTGPNQLIEFEKVLRSLSFSSSNSNPVEGIRQIDISCKDDHESVSTIQTVLVEVENFVDLPTIDISGHHDFGTNWVDTLAADEKSIPITHPDASIRDLDSHQIDFCAVRLPGKVHPGEGFTFDRRMVAPSMSWAWYEGSGVLYLTGPGSTDDFSTFLRSIRYTRLAPLPYSSVEISVQCVDLQGNSGPIATSTIFLDCLPPCNPVHPPKVLLIDHQCNDC